MRRFTPTTARKNVPAYMGETQDGNWVEADYAEELRSILREIVQDAVHVPADGYAPVKEAWIAFYGPELKARIDEVLK